jgi:hypothetical protein
MMNFHAQHRYRVVTLSAAKGLSRWADRCFAALSMTGLTLVVKVHYRGYLSPRQGSRACPFHDDHTTISGYEITGAQPPQAALLAVFPGYPVEPLILLSASA